MTAETKTKKKGGSQAEGTRRSYFVFTPDECIIVGLDTKDGKEHPLYDERIKLPVDEALVRSIQTYGVLKPILFERDGDRVLVVAGRRRVRAARVAAERQRNAGELEVVVPAIPKRGDGAMLFGISRAENAHNAPDGILLNARNAQRMLDMGASEEVVAVSFGVGPQTIKAWLALLGLAPDVIKAVEGGTISPTAAVALGKISRAEQSKKLKELTAGGAKPTVADAAAKVRAASGKAPIETPKGKLIRITNAITKLDGTPCSCPPDRHDALEVAFLSIKSILGLGKDS
jgi:ParB family chromosome partitioning protein